MKKMLFAALLLSSAAPALAAPIIDSSVVVPDELVLINFGGSGLDWVYAAPIAPEELGPLDAAPVAYRTAEGWRAATDDEWAARPVWTDFLLPGVLATDITVYDGFGDHTKLRFASAYFSSYDHVDLNDFIAGRVTDGVHGKGFAVPETIYVRATRTAVPEPATFGLLGLGLIGLGLRRRRM